MKQAEREFNFFTFLAGAEKKQSPEHGIIETDDLENAASATIENNFEKQQMLPGESFFKRTKCEIDDEINFSNDLNLNAPLNPVVESNLMVGKLHSEASSCKSKTTFSNYPVPAKRTHKSSVSVDDQTLSLQPKNIGETRRELLPLKDSEMKKTKPMDSQGFNHSPPVSGFSSTNYEFIKRTSKSPYINKVGTKILKTPSGARLPISPLAKHSSNNSAFGQDKKRNDNNIRSISTNSGTILAVRGKNYFDSDSDSESASSEEEHEFLFDATTSNPIYPEEMENSTFASSRNGDKNSFLFRRTTSTDNFQQLLFKTTETSRCSRHPAENNFSNVINSKAMDFKPEIENKPDSSWLNSSSASFPSRQEPGGCIEVSNLKERLVQSKLNKLDYSEKETNSNIISNLCGQSAFKSPDALQVESSLPHQQDKKDTSVVLSSNATNGTEQGFGLGQLARCASCGITTQTKMQEHNVLNSSLSKHVVKEAPPNTPTKLVSSGIKSVSSSTQVTPEKESASFPISSIDLCQLSALIQALRNSNDDSMLELTKLETSKVNAEKFLNKNFETIPITTEPLSAKSIVEQRFHDVATETCPENKLVVTPRDKVIVGRIQGDGFVSYRSSKDFPRVQLKSRDAAVGTDDNEIYSSRCVPPGFNNTSSSLSYDQNQFDRKHYNRFQPERENSYHWYHPTDFSAFYDSRSSCYDMAKAIDFPYAYRVPPPHIEKHFYNENNINQAAKQVDKLRSTPMFQSQQFLNEGFISDATPPFYQQPFRRQIQRYYPSGRAVLNGASLPTRMNRCGSVSQQHVEENNVDKNSMDNFNYHYGQWKKSAGLLETKTNSQRNRLSGTIYRPLF